MPAHNGHLQLPFAEGVHNEMEFEFAECTGLREQVRGKWQFKRILEVTSQRSYGKYILFTLSITDLKACHTGQPAGGSQWNCWQPNRPH